MENEVILYKGYVISTEEGLERGIFFRSPIQRVGFDAYYDNPKFSAWQYLNAIKNPIRRLYEILMGNRKIVKNIQAWSESRDWGGFNANILCFPIYFKRDYCKLIAHASEGYPITKIYSYGYTSEFSDCAGECVIERTKIRLRTGKVIRIKRRKTYLFTYLHKVKEIIDTGNIN